MVSSILQSSVGGGLQELLRSMQKEQEELLDPTNPASALEPALDSLSLSPQTTNASTSMMAGNFASTEREDSKYINASLNSFSVAKQMDNQATNRVTALLDSLGGIQGPTLYDGTGSKRGIPEAAIQRAMKRIQNVEAQEATERNLEEIKDGIKEKAQEAAAPKDENGNPIEGLPTESAGETAPMPEISGSNPAPAPDVSAAPTPAPAPEVAAAPAPMPEVSAPAAPSTPSINITV